MTQRERIPAPLLFVIATAFGVSSTFQAYWLDRITHDHAMPHTLLHLLALGAQKNDVIRLVLNHSMAAALIGVGVGLAASLALTRFLTALLFDVKPMDPIVLGSAALILASVAFVACYLPARRATKVDPIVALRCE